MTMGLPRVMLSDNRREFNNELDTGIQLLRNAYMYTAWLDN